MGRKYDFGKIGKAKTIKSQHFSRGFLQKRDDFLQKSRGLGAFWGMLK